MKDRMTALDIRRVIVELQPLVGMRLSNFYDINKKTYLLKLAKPDQKQYLILESGIRIHTMSYTVEHPTQPSIFAMKIRNRIRAKRLNSITQYGMDRVVSMSFGAGEFEHHLILELYAAGNVILADANHEIVALLRPYTPASGESVCIGGHYPPPNERKSVSLTMEELVEAIDEIPPNRPIRDIRLPVAFGKQFWEHCLTVAKLKPKSLTSSLDRKQIPELFWALTEGLKLINDPTTLPGYIYYTLIEDQGKGKDKEKETIIEKQAEEENLKQMQDNERENWRYESFLPFKGMQFSEMPYHERQFNSFNEACDEFFTHILSIKVDVQRLTQVDKIEGKAAKVKKDHEKRISALESQAAKFDQYARAILASVDTVEHCLVAVRKSIAQQMTWERLWEKIQEEKERGDPVACIVSQLKLESNEIILCLPEESGTYDSGGDNSEGIDGKKVRVSIDLGLSAHGNATEYFNKKKQCLTKISRTHDAAALAIRSAKIKGEKAKQTVKEVKGVRSIRKPYWFEKFYWFITSENYLAIAGRDVQQNELIYKRYLSTYDLYFHADLHGASSVVCKNFSKDPVPPMSIDEVGRFAMCHSAAWKAKSVADAYWVHSSQVSKTAPSGEYLTPGSFMIRGRKHLLGRAPLVLGFGILFVLGEDSVASHLKERQSRMLMNEEGPENENSSDSKKNVENGDVGDLKKADKKEEKKVNRVSEIDGKNAENKDSKEEASEKIEEKAAKAKSDDDEELEIEAEKLMNGVGVSLLRKSGLQHSDSRMSEEKINQGKDHEDSETEKNPATIATPISPNEKKKKISAYERRQLKRKGKLPTTVPEENQLEEAKTEREEVVDSEEKKSLLQPAKPLTRRQKQKLKKKKQKYGWQDEEDRKISMELLGHIEPSQKAKLTSKQKKRLKKQQQMERAQELKKEHKEHINYRLEKEKEEEEIRNLLREENVEMLTEEQKKRIEETTAQGLGVNLSQLTGKPREGDELLWSVCVCGPWSAVRDYKYRIKVMPGGEKKGRACQTIRQMLLKQAEGREHELIKNITDSEMQLALKAPCKLFAPGLSGIRSKKKK